MFPPEVYWRGTLIFNGGAWFFKENLSIRGNLFAGGEAGTPAKRWHKVGATWMVCHA
jgi:hypothetical protein